MCSEIEGRDFNDYPKIAIVMTIFFLCLKGGLVRAQTLPEKVVSIVEQMVEEGASQADVDSYIEAYGSLVSKPFNINSAGREKLSELGFLSVFQIESLLSYIEQYGAISNSTELSFVDGFSQETVELLSPLVVYGDSGAPGASELFSPLSANARYRIKKGHASEGLYNSLRIGTSAGRFDANVTLESDAGERFADFGSGYLAYNFKKCDAKLLAGDFTARYGQGLTLWNAFSVASLGTPSSILKRGDRITPYKGVDENNFFRGVAFTHAPSDRWHYSLFFSYNRIDGSATDSTYSSLVADGLHRTQAEIDRKDSVGEMVTGLNVNYLSSHFKLGLSAVAYRYDKRNARKVQEYNRYQQYDGWYGNIALNALYSLNHLRIFSEVAVDARGSVAALLGLGWSPSYSFEIFSMLRHYPKEYIATHAGAYSSQTSISNQEGATLNFLLRFNEKWTLYGFADAVYYPWQRYRVKVPSCQVKARFKGEYSDNGITICLQESYTFRSNDLSSKHSFRAAFKASLGSSLKIGVQADGCILYSKYTPFEKGFALSCDGVYTAFRGVLSAAVGMSYCNTDSYDSRIYVYERDLPQSFSSAALYGRAFSLYGVVYLKKLRIGKIQLNLSLKASTNKDIRGQAEIVYD
ncbi:MAG: hypothetical protein IJS02_02090 [Bacteroidales bacterium]|nr:hypothetical protein [Bacteroidales bacterium]